MSSTKLKTANIVSLDATKLTGTLPAISGANLTGVAPFTVSASDPVVTTNPSGGVGTIWMNSTSGETYCCTDATAGSNVWTNCGTGFDHTHSDSFQGEIAGFSSGGHSTARVDVIDTFSFLTDGGSTDHGNLTVSRYQVSGSSSSTHGYTHGGTGNASPSKLDHIDKFAFNTGSNATDVGNLANARSQTFGLTSPTHGYCAGGDQPPVTKNIQKYSFSSDGNATNVGNLSLERSIGATSVTTTHGYSSGGYHLDAVPFPYITIDRFAFSSDGTALDVGDLSVTRYSCSGTSSLTHGYVAGGYVSGVNANTAAVERFSFASTASGADVGDLQVANGAGSSGHSSTTHGYVAYKDDGIQKYNYSSSITSSTIGQNTHQRTLCAGTQY